MKNILPSVLVLTTALLSGCMGASTTAPKPMETRELETPERHSLAYQVAYAAGITDGGLRDAVVPADQVNRSNLIGDVGFASFTTPPGVSGDLNFGIALVGNLISEMGDKYESQKPHLIAWMPENMAATSEGASAKLTDIMKAAADKALASAPGTRVYHIDPQELAVDTAKNADALGREGLIGLSTYRTGQKETLFFSKLQPSDECPKNKYGLTDCDGVIRIMDSSLSDSPSFSQNRGQSWFFGHTSNGSTYDLRRFEWNDEIGLLGEISKHLPNWVYLYVPAKRIKDANGDLVRVPLMLNSGKAHYFITSEDA